MSELEDSHHFFRHIKKAWMQGDFIDPAAFRIRIGHETGLSVNWAEYFGQSNFKDAISPLKHILEAKGRTVGGQSKFALLNVSRAKEAASLYVPITVEYDAEPNDKSHALVKGYDEEAYNDLVAEELAKVIIHTYPAVS
jgi:hypothetical protein